jgi:hypothetical protein
MKWGTKKLHISMEQIPPLPRIEWGALSDSGGIGIDVPDDYVKSGVYHDPIRQQG